MEEDLLIDGVTRDVVSLYRTFRAVFIVKEHTHTLQIDTSGVLSRVD